MTKTESAHTLAIDMDGALERLAALDWASITAELDRHGCAPIGPVLTPDQCEALADSYNLDGLFRSRVVMARHGFGLGEY